MENEEVQQEIQNVVTNTSRIRNKVAAKFLMVISTIKILGYGAAILVGGMIMMADDDMAFIGLVTGAVIALVTWLSCLLWEAIAEGLQLLEDIKNK